MSHPRHKPEQRDAILALVAARKPDKAIMAELGVTKNAVIAVRNRAGVRANVDPESINSVAAANRAASEPEPQTLFDRMDALKAKMDAVLAESSPRPSHWQKPQKDEKADAAPLGKRRLSLFD